MSYVLNILRKTMGEEEGHPPTQNRTGITQVADQVHPHLKE